MKDPLLPIGSIVLIEERNSAYMVIGHRMINYQTMNPWDYVAVQYPQGLKRHFKHDKTHDSDNFMYFNHVDIEKVIKRAKVVITGREEESD